ncbi:MAG: site-2 protease family protein [Candidatus Norongarragalinales archaeon]
MAGKVSLFSFSVVEVAHILVSVITISLAFSLFKGELFDPNYFAVVLVAVGSAFILHELGHRTVARHYGVHSEYRAWTWGLFLAIAMAFATRGAFVFAAPGAVYIFGRVTREQNGKISIAGPATNFIVAIAFLALFFTTPCKELCATAAYVNVVLGAFNMMPFSPLDGAKIAAWNSKAWGALFLAFLALLFAMAAF